MDKERDARLQRKLQTELGPDIRAALSDATVVEVDVNPDGKVWVERHGRDMECLGRMTPQGAMNLVCTVAALTGRCVTPASPILEAMLPDGSRFHATIPPITSAPAIAIRKHLAQVLRLEAYRDQAILSDYQYRLLRRAVHERRNIVVAGGTGSGKTTLTNALIGAIAELTPHHRVLVLEDTPEIHCTSHNHVKKQTTVEVDMRTLVRSCLRMRPDRIVVGEVRGAEAEALIRAWNTGHAGGMATIHCSSAHAALLKLEEYVADAVAGDKRRSIADAVDVVVFVEKTSTSRMVREMLAVKGFVNDNYVTETIDKEVVHVA